MSPPATSTLRKVTARTVADAEKLVDGYRFNVMVAKVMELVNATRKAIDTGCGPDDPAVREAAETVAIVLSMVAPYTAEEMWERLGHEPSVAQASWPVVDESLLVEETVTAVVQIQGKVKARLEVAPDVSEADLEAAALADPDVVRAIDGREVRTGDRARPQAGQHRRLTLIGTSLLRMTVALVTDSTASLPPEVAEECRVSVVPVQVVIDDVSYDEGAEEASPTCVAAALREKRSVSTSRPAPAVFADLYRRLADEGASEILSVHLSSEVSGTLESAQVAARHAPVPVTCVDTRQVGFGTGYAVESAAAVLADGGSRRGRRRGRAPAGGSGHVGVLRRHARVPPPRWPDRRRGRRLRRGAGGEAAPRHRRTA